MQSQHPLRQRGPAFQKNAQSYITDDDRISRINDQEGDASSPRVSLTSLHLGEELAETSCVSPRLHQVQPAAKTAICAPSNERNVTYPYDKQASLKPPAL